MREFTPEEKELIINRKEQYLSGKLGILLSFPNIYTNDYFAYCTI